MDAKGQLKPCPFCGSYNLTMERKASEDWIAGRMFRTPTSQEGKG